MNEARFRALARAAQARYDARDRFARGFAYGKLTGDPAFRHILAHGLLPAGGSILDLGCGQAVLGALLEAARERHAAGDWPDDTPPPPNPRAYRGIDLVPKEIDRARQALGDRAELVAQDIRTADFGRADAVVILDVLHYIDGAAQDHALRRVRAALADGGVLLLRVADADGSWRYRYTVGVDRAVMLLRGHGLVTLYNRPVAAWLEDLRALGFEASARPMSEGTAFGNVLLHARYHRRAA